MEAAILALFNTLESYGLKVNPEKSHMIIQVKGTQMKKMVKSRTVLIKNQPHWRLQSGEQQTSHPFKRDHHLSWHKKFPLKKAQTLLLSIGWPRPRAKPLR